MRARLRLVLFALIALPATAATALASYSPSLMVSRQQTLRTTNTDITFTQAATDDPTASLVVYSPAGFSVRLNQAAGTRIGTVDGSVVAAQLGGGTVKVTGTIAAADPNNAALQAAAADCTEQRFHTAIWLLTLTAGTQRLPNPLPVYVDARGGAFSASLQLCLSHPSVAPLGIKLVSATLHVSGVFTPGSTPADSRWTAVNVPWMASTPDVNLFGMVETQVLDPAPVASKLVAKLVTKTRKVKHRTGTDVRYSYSARITGELKRGPTAAAGAKVDLFAGRKKVASTTTSGNGSFRRSFKLTRTTTFHATFSMPTATVAASCNPTLPFGNTVIACGTITRAGFSAESPRATVKKPKLTVRHLGTKAKPRKKPKPGRAKPR